MKELVKDFVILLIGVNIGVILIICLFHINRLRNIAVKKGKETKEEETLSKADETESEV